MSRAPGWRKCRRYEAGSRREVDQRRSAELALARKAKQLESSNADLREFAYVTSHDLQEPLRSVNGFAQLLSRRYKGKLDQDADEFLDYITDASTPHDGDDPRIAGLFTRNACRGP